MEQKQQPQTPTPQRRVGTAAASCCSNSARAFTWDEIGQHNTPESCWIVAHGSVYDATALLASGLHPGGQSALLRCAGQDATAHFDMHSRAGQKYWARFLVGRVAAPTAEQKEPGLLHKLLSRLLRPA